jgi:hypothetical protein
MFCVSLRACIRRGYTPLILLLGLQTFAVVGCGGTTVKAEKLVAASGNLMLDGRPMEGVRLFFQPLEGTKSAGGCSAITDQNGSFKVTHWSNKEGCPPGKYQVLISRKLKDDGTPLAGNESPTMVRATETISKMYSDPAKSGTHNTVEIPDKGTTSLDFKISSIQQPRRK